MYTKFKYTILLCIKYILYIILTNPGDYVQGIMSGVILPDIILIPWKFQANPSVTFLVILLANFLPYLAMVKNPKIRSCNLDLWPMTSKFNGIVERLSRYTFRTKLHRAKSSGSWVIVSPEKQRHNKNTSTMIQTILSSVQRTVTNTGFTVQRPAIPRLAVCTQWPIMLQ